MEPPPPLLLMLLLFNTLVIDAADHRQSVTRKSKGGEESVCEKDMANFRGQ